MTRATDDNNAVVISLALEGLSGDTRELGGRIRRMVAGYHAAEEARAKFNGANDEIEALGEMVKALKLTQRKMRAAPQSLRLWVELNTPENWDGTVSEFERVVTPVLSALEQAQAHMTEYRQGPGNPAAMENRDLLLAIIRRWLRTAGANDYVHRTQIILQTYGVPCPTDRKAFARAAERGEELLDGPAADGSWDWLREQLAEKGQ